MIRLISDFCLKNKLSKWWNKKKDVIREEYVRKENLLVAELDEKYQQMELRLKTGNADLENKIENLEEEEKRVLDRKKELARVNEELKVQIRMIEAKASPDHVWESAFSLGFSKAWDMMVPLMTQGIDKIKEKIREQEIQASFPRIDMVVDQKIKDLREHNLVETRTLQSKRSDFLNKMAQTQSEDEKKKYSYYINLLDWVLGIRNGN